MKSTHPKSSQRFSFSQRPQYESSLSILYLSQTFLYSFLLLPIYIIRSNHALITIKKISISITFRFEQTRTKTHWSPEKAQAASITFKVEGQKLMWKKFFRILSVYITFLMVLNFKWRNGFRNYCWQESFIAFLPTCSAWIVFLLGRSKKGKSFTKMDPYSVTTLWLDGRSNFTT